MSNWMEGYNSDIEYTAKYYNELSPDYINISAALANIEPIPTDQPFIYCELGCGQGMTALIMAANYPQGTFYAIDYNPSHVAKARKLADQANLNNIHFLEKSFKELIDNHHLLPEVDFMVFHGVYSWVSDANRTHLIHLCQKHVKSGGLVYNSYNAKPGWSQGEAIQKLIYGLSFEHTGSSLSRMKKTVQILDEIKNIESGYFIHNKAAIDAIFKKIKTSDEQYVVHEYLNEGWRAFFFPEVSNEMAKAKLNYLCSSFPADAYVNSLLPENTRKHLHSLEDENNRELLKDLILNTAFRKDIYIRGIHNRTNFYQMYAWFEKKRWILISTSKNKTLKINLSAGEVTIDKDNYTAVIDTLNNSILSTDELQIKTGISKKALIQTLVMLYSSDQIALYREEVTKEACNLNRILSNNVFNANISQPITFPHTHSGAMMDTVSIAWLDGIYKGLTSSEALVEHVYHDLSQRNLSLTHNEKKLSGEAMKKRLYILESEWRKEVLPFWIKLGVVDLH